MQNILSPVLKELSPEDAKVPSTISQDTGDNSDMMEKENIVKGEEGYPSSKADSLIGYTKPFYHCKQHPLVENIHKEVIEHYLIHSTDHRSP